MKKIGVTVFGNEYSEIPSDHWGIDDLVFARVRAAAAANTRCTRYIVITRFAGNLPGTNQALTGIGVFTHGPFGGVLVHAYIKVTVFDGQTFDIRKDPFASLGARLSESLSQFVKDEYFRGVKGAELPAAPEEAARDTKLRDGARELVTERLDKMLPEYFKE